MRIKVVNGKIMEDSEWSGMLAPEEFVPNTVQLRELSREELAAKDRQARREAQKRWMKRKLDEEQARREALIARDAEIRQQALYNKQLFESQKYWNIKQAQRKFAALKAQANWGFLANDNVQNSSMYLDVIDNLDWANRKAREEAALDVPLDELEREYEAANQNLDVMTEDFYTRAAQEETFFQAPSALVVEAPTVNSTPVATVTLQDIFAGLRAFFLKG